MKNFFFPAILITATITALLSFNKDEDKYTHLKNAISEDLKSKNTRTDSMDFVAMEELSTRTFLQTAAGSFDFQLGDDSFRLAAFRDLLNGAQDGVKNGEPYTKEYVEAENNVKKYTAEIEGIKKDIARHKASRDSCLKAAAKANATDDAGYACRIFIRFRFEDNTTDTLSIQYLFSKDKLADSWPAFLYR
jgi:hypothetical protein